MKKYFFLVLSFLCYQLKAQYDGFSGTGNLSNNNWTAHGSAGTGPVQIITSPSDDGSSLKYNGVSSPVGNRIQLISSQAEDLNKAFSNPVTTTAFVSFFLKYTDVSNLADNSLATAPTYFAHLSPLSGASIGTSWQTRVSIRKGSTPNTFNIGVLNTTGGTISATEIFGASPVDYNINTTYFVVIKYDLTTSSTSGTSSIWINPNIGTVAPAPNATSSAGTSTKPTQIEAFAIRQASSTSAIGSTGTFEIDEVRLGTTWQDVVIPDNLSVIDQSKKKNFVSNTIVKDQFRVLSSKKTLVEIYSSNGNLAKKTTVNSNEFVNVSELPKGVYFVKIIAENEISTVKIIKQ